MPIHLEDIYQDFDEKLRRFILKRVSDPDATEDILQEVYLKIHAGVADLRDTDRLEPWMYQIARNTIIDHYRRQRPQEELSDTFPLSEENETDGMTELAPSVHSMLACLDEKYRQALVLTEMQGLTQLQMADRLGISLSGAKSRVQRAREKLKQAFLDCCHFEFDRLGRVISHQPRCSHCEQDCAEPSSGCS